MPPFTAIPLGKRPDYFTITRAASPRQPRTRSHVWHVNPHLRIRVLTTQHNSMQADECVGVYARDQTRAYVC